MSHENYCQLFGSRDSIGVHFLKVFLLVNTATLGTRPPTHTPTYKKHSPLISQGRWHKTEIPGLRNPRQENPKPEAARYCIVKPYLKQRLEPENKKYVRQKAKMTKLNHVITNSALALSLKNLSLWGHPNSEHVSLRPTRLELLLDLTDERMLHLRSLKTEAGFPVLYLSCLFNLPFREQCSTNLPGP